MMAARLWLVAVFAACCVAHSSQKPRNFDVELKQNIKKRLMNARFGNWVPEKDLQQKSVTNSHSNAKDSGILSGLPLYKKKSDSRNKHNIDNAKDLESFDMDIDKNIRMQRLQKYEKEISSGTEPDINDNNDLTSFDTDSDKYNLKQLLHKYEQERPNDSRRNMYEPIDLESVEMDINRNSRKQRLQKYKQGRNKDNERGLDNEQDLDIGKNIRKKLLNVILQLDGNSYKDEELDATSLTNSLFKTNNQNHLLNTMQQEQLYNSKNRVSEQDIDNVDDSDLYSIDITNNIKKQRLPKNEQENISGREQDEDNAEDLQSYDIDNDNDNRKQLLQKYKPGKNTGSQRNIYKNNRNQGLQKYTKKINSGREQAIYDVNDSEPYSMDIANNNIKKQRLQKYEQNSNSGSEQDVDIAEELESYNTNNRKNNLKQILQKYEQERNRDSQRSRKQRLQKYKQERNNGNKQDIDNVNDLKAHTMDISKNIRKQLLKIILQLEEKHDKDSELDTDVKNMLNRHLSNIKQREYEQKKQ